MPDAFADINNIIAHLEALHESFYEYFPEDNDKLYWVRNPFSEASPNDLRLTASLQDLTEYSSTRDSFKEEFKIKF